MNSENLDLNLKKMERMMNGKIITGNKTEMKFMLCSRIGLMKDILEMKFLK